MSSNRVTTVLAPVLTFAGPGDVSAAEDRESPQVRALVEAAKAGDREAFGDLVTLHEQAVFRTALAALGQRADAEDVAQDAFVVAWTKLPGFRGDSMFRTWLLTIVWRKALDRRRQTQTWWRRTRAASTPNDATPADPFEGLAIEAADPERHAVSRDLADRARAEIQRLSPKLRDTLLLATSGEHSYEQIAGMLGVPLGTVKWRVAEARRILTRRLAVTR